MLSVFETGDDSFRLSNSKDEEVGWIRGRALGMTAITDEDTALAAAVAGADALAAWLERQSGTSGETVRSSGKVKLLNVPATEEREGDTEREREAQDWIVRGKERLARLYRPDADGTGGSYAVEFLLPSYVKSGTVISAAQVVYNAVSNIRSAASKRAPSVSTGATTYGGTKGRTAAAGA